MKIIVVISFILFNALSVLSQSLVNTTPLQTVGVDQFGRSFPAIEGYKAKKQVGIFYWPWIGQPYASGVYDATKIAALPNGKRLLFDFKYQNDSISPNLQAHFWGEPLWGYYNSEDQWVMHKQMKMLSTAGIDFIVLDFTNTSIFPEVTKKLLTIIENLITQGTKVPRVVFYTHSRSMQTTINAYNQLYRSRPDSKAWYRVKGKPMIIAYTDPKDDRAEAMSRGDTSYHPVAYTDEVKDFFYFKKPQWPFDPVFEDGFPWIEWTYPQPLHGNTMSVSVASHPKVPMSRSVTSGWINWGRGWDPVTEQNIAADIDKGGYFQKQWEHALKVDPDTVFIGGWNEWVALKQPYGDEYMLCDAVNKEYSRDIEPMRGGYEDAFYIQMIKNIRKYKGLTDSSTGYGPIKINIQKGTNQWAKVKAIYTNTDTSTAGRNSYGVTQKVKYEMSPPANHIRTVRVAHDKQNFYFLIEADKPFMLPESDTTGLQLLMGKGAPALKGWNGYEYLIEPDIETKKGSVYRLDKNRHKTKLGSIPFSKNGRQLQLQVPRKLISATAASDIQQIYFKVAYGVRRPSFIMEYYVSGSVLPMGRLSYVYKLKNKQL